LLESLERLAKEAESAPRLQSLLGFEGAAAEIYFGRFGDLLKSSQDFSFQNRNKRPPPATQISTPRILTPADRFNS
jgi:CRISPR-associated protein Cas1